MAKTIVQKVLFKNTTPAILYQLYMNAKKHSMVTGATAVITAREGSKYAAHGNYIKGRNLQLIKDKLIVQSWRASDWNKDDIDSTFIIDLEQRGRDTLLHVTHANLPDEHAGGIDKGWHDYYWKPWKQWIAGKAITPAEM